MFVNEERTVKTAVRQYEKSKSEDLNLGRLCPKCKKGRLYDRVPRAYIMKTIFFFMPLRRYKCYYCGKKPYVLS